MYDIKIMYNPVDNIKEIKDFCYTAISQDRTKKHIKRNMDPTGISNSSLIYRILKTDKYKNNRGIITPVYYNGKIVSISGSEIYNDDIIIMGKRYFTLREHRHKQLFLRYMILNQWIWVDFVKKQHSLIITTINEEDKGILRLWKKEKVRKFLYPLKYKVNDNKSFIEGVEQYTVEFYI